MTTQAPAPAVGAASAVKRLVYRTFGAPADVLALEDDAPAPVGAGEVAVRMSLAPINASDLIPMSGAYRHRIALPAVAGYEGVGRVVEAGAGARRLLGRRVLPLRGAGTWQTRVVCAAAWAVPVPDDLEDGTAARAYINPMAAHLMLRRWPAAGRSVLLTAAGSACARLLARWAVEQGAADLRGVVDTDAHDRGLRVLGVRTVRAGDREAVAAAARRSDLVFDAVGGDLAAAIAAAVPACAAFVSYGALSGRPAPVVRGGPMPERFHLRDTLAGLTPEAWQRRFEALWEPLRVAAQPPAAPFPLGRWRDALAAFGTRGRSAKPILVFPDGAAPRAIAPEARRP